jgi:hypothetical protein
MSSHACPVLDALALLVVKQGVALGALPQGERQLALALVWAGLPAEGGLSEREVNVALQAQLAGAAAFLGTDHVELRRWLVDAGWLTRDGFGHEYRRVPLRALSGHMRALGAALSIIEPARWCAGLRAEQRERREARRRAWLGAARGDHDAGGSSAGGR